MTQPKIEDYIIDNKTLKSNVNLLIKIEEPKKIKENIEQINESNGIVEVRYGNEVYKTWTVELILPLVTKFLKGLYPDSLIVRGLTDIVVFDRKTKDIVPTEIQKSTIKNTKHGNKFTIAEFEDKIRRQLEDNIENYDKCWFFFDSEYLRFLQSGNVGKKASINLIWLVKLMREEKLKVFAIKHNGEVKELTSKDFGFLKDMSQTCPISCDSDERILNRNKLKIKQNVLFGYNFTQQEIYQFESEFDNRGNSKFISSQDYFMNNNNERCKLYGRTLHSFNNLSNINDTLSCIIDKNPYTHYGIILGLFHQNNFYGFNDDSRIQFIDKFNVAQYFPGYLRNKEMWDYCKNKQRIFTIPEFRGIVEGREHCLKLVKQQSRSLADYD